MTASEFDPIAVLQALERRRVAYVVIGALGRVIRGSDELTGGLDIVPSTKDDNVRRLGLALEELGARRQDGRAPVLERDLAAVPVLELETAAGEVKLVPLPAGTRGYEDLRRAATREPLGRGLRPEIASLDDQVRMLAALDRKEDREPLRTLGRLMELEREVTRSRGVEF